MDRSPNCQNTIDDSVVSSAKYCREDWAAPNMALRATPMSIMAEGVAAVNLESSSITRTDTNENSKAQNDIP